MSRSLDAVTSEHHPYLCEECGDVWGPDGLIVLNVKEKGEKSLCWPCVERAMACNHADNVPKKCVVCCPHE